MKILFWVYLLSFALCSSILHRGLCVAAEIQADHPPRGWNSYDSYSWIISENEFLNNAKTLSTKLSSHGYEYAVVDFLWYRKNVEGASVYARGYDTIDEWGRVIPEPNRWPSSTNGNGFSTVAKTVHDMGLKFGIHVMRGISTQAVDANTPILDTTKGSAYEEGGRKWTAKDIALQDRTCKWMSEGFMSVNTKTGAGRAFLRSLYEQYAAWGVDFVKHDCIFGDDLDLDEITSVSEILKGLDRPILYSLSPGVQATPDMAKKVSSLVNMYRITGDDWDTWKDVEAHFGVSSDFAEASMIGTTGLKGKSWPDLDMLPLGWLSDAGVREGPHRKCNLNLDEQRTQMTLWAITKTPIMFGGDLLNLDDATYNIITQPELLELNSFSSNNREFYYKTGAQNLKSSSSVLALRSQNQKEGSILEKHSFNLISCNDPKAKGWGSHEVLDSELEQICWRDNSRSKSTTRFCLNKRNPLLTSDANIVNEQQYQGKLHLLLTETTQLCLDASPRQKLTSKEFPISSFSPCRWDSNQMWELNDNGTLVSSYSGLCATVKPMEDNANVIDVRGWFASGKGKSYIALFNLSSRKQTVSVNLPSVAMMMLPGQNINAVSCTSREIWTGKDNGVVNTTITADLEIHGCALFVLNCKSYY